MFSKKTILHSIGNGTISPIDTCIDPVFSEKIVGDGYLFTPRDNNIYSPISGNITMVADTNHALGVTSKKYELLIHIGIESVKLKEQLITPVVKEGDTVNQGDLIATVDLSKLKSVLPSTQTPVLITNLDGKQIKLLKTGLVSINDKILEIK